MVIDVFTSNYFLLRRKIEKKIIIAIYIPAESQIALKLSQIACGILHANCNWIPLLIIVFLELKTITANFTHLFSET